MCTCLCRFPDGESGADVYDRLTIFEDHVSAAPSYMLVAQMNRLTAPNHTLVAQMYRLTAAGWDLAAAMPALV